MSRRIFLTVALLFALAFARDRAEDRLNAWVAATDLPPLAVATGVEVLARDDSLLRAFQVADGRWRLAPGAVDPGFVDMLLMWEDGRFYHHSGVDGRAVARAGWQALRHGRVVSGASTLSMQVARLLEEGPTGKPRGKLRQIRVALALERRLTKPQILDLYLRLAPYGANVEGVRAASLLWFGKEPRRLTPAQAALLVALPQAPESRRPDRFPDRAKAARDRVLARALERGLIDAPLARAAMAEPVPRARRAFPALAPHLSERLRRQNPGAIRIPTTIDPTLQARAEALAARATRGQTARLSAAIILADHRSGEILAQVGASDWTATPSGGFIDMTQAWRSPGSTLKPFVYGLAFDQGLAHPETLIEDRPAIFGRWQPQNFDRHFRGTVSVRQALIASLNIPVVRLAEALGPARIVQTLRRGGVDLRTDGAPGLALVLGGGGVTLEGLAQGYAALAQGGRGVVLSAQPGPHPRRATPMFNEVAAWQVGQILSQLAPPPGARAKRLAYKTGTSYGHRDALAVGYDGAHVGAVWLGRPDGTPVPGAFGGDLAAPWLFDLFDAVPAVPLPPPPAATLMLPNAALPLPLQRFAAPGEATRANQRLSETLRLTYPPDGAEIDAPDRKLIAKVRGGRAPFTFLLNNAPVVIANLRPEAEIPFSGPGFARLTVIDATGASNSVRLRLR